MVLFEKLGLTPVKKTKTGPSTDADSLQKMAEDHPIVADLLRYREVEKLRNTYADALPPLVRDDGRVHATFKQTDTTTGRISSSDPNLQNIPVRTADGREFRRAFVADDGSGLLTADYSQIELRVLADLAEDPGLIDAFDRGVDIHTATAAKVFHRGGRGDGRRSAVRQGRQLRPRVRDGGVRPRAAHGRPDRGSARHPRRLLRGVPERRGVHVRDGRRGEAARLHHDDLRAAPADLGAVVRQLPHPSDGGADGAERAIQGSAADIFKLAMVAVDAALEESGFATQMLLTVHDELVFEVPETEHKKVEPVIRETMESVATLKVPLVVHMGFGETWASAK